MAHGGLLPLGWELMPQVKIYLKLLYSAAPNLSNMTRWSCECDDTTVGRIFVFDFAAAFTHLEIQHSLLEVPFPKQQW